MSNQDKFARMLAWHVKSGLEREGVQFSTPPSNRRVRHVASRRARAATPGHPSGDGAVLAVQRAARRGIAFWAKVLGR